MAKLKKGPQRLSKEYLLPMMAQHVLNHGMSAASLRPLAKAAGTSDRMLIYHFGNKELLIAEILAFIATAYSDALDGAMPDSPAKSRAELCDRIMMHTDNPSMESFLALWWDIVAGAARGKAGYKEAAQSVMAQLLEWLTNQMPQGDPDPVGGAHYLLTLIEGAQMLKVVGHQATGQRGVAAAGL